MRSCSSEEVSRHRGLWGSGSTVRESKGSGAHFASFDEETRRRDGVRRSVGLSAICATLIVREAPVWSLLSLEPQVGLFLESSFVFPILHLPEPELPLFNLPF